VALIKSISGIRGTIGGRPGENLSPPDIVKYTAAFCSWVKEKKLGKKIVIGRDGRISGEMLRQLVVSVITASGIDVIDLGLSTTPTVELAVLGEVAAGGIILTASHNPKEWNALKLLNHTSEFISAEDGADILRKAEMQDFNFASVDQLGTYTLNHSYLEKHINAVVNHPLVDVIAIRQKQYKVVLDAINSTGSIFIPPLLKELGVEEVIVINGEVNGRFAHNPEPLPQNLTALSSAVLKAKASMGIAVDPDVDRLCFVCEDGSMFGEEYTLVSVADYVL
jgi:phosphomannomutase